MKIYVKKVDGLVLPAQGSELAAGYDIVATSEPKIVGQKHTPVGYESSEVGNEWDSVDYIEYETNLFIAPTVVTFHTLIHPRSSISKYNLVLANSIGLIDNDYRGMVICRFKYQWQPEDYKIFPRGADGHGNWLCKGTINMNKIYSKGDKIAQLVVEPTIQVEFELVDDLTQTQRGSGGFGSSDSVRQSVSATTILADLFLKSDHNFPTPDKNAYSQAIKERENNIEQQ
jgi:dUTP pyrophosphatase